MRDNMDRHAGVEQGIVACQTERSKEIFVHYVDF